VRQQNDYGSLPQERGLPAILGPVTKSRTHTSIKFHTVRHKKEHRCTIPPRDVCHSLSLVSSLGQFAALSNPFSRCQTQRRSNVHVSYPLRRTAQRRKTISQFFYQFSKQFLFFFPQYGRKRLVLEIQILKALWLQSALHLPRFASSCNREAHP